MRLNDREVEAEEVEKAMTISLSRFLGDSVSFGDSAAVGPTERMCLDIFLLLRRRRRLGRWSSFPY